MRSIAGLYLFLSIVTSGSIRAACVAPGVPVITAAPATVGIAQPYAIQWSNNAGSEGFYIVERSTSAAFEAGVESQFTSKPASSFLALGEGTFYHRVQAVAGCDNALRSARSTPVLVTVASQPTATIGPSDEARQLKMGPIHAAIAADAGQPLLILPSVARVAGAGGSRYLSSLRLNNTSTRAIDVELVYLPINDDINSGFAVSRTLNLGANGAVAFQDVLAELFNLDSTFGSLEVRSAERSVEVLTGSGPVTRLSSTALQADYVNPVILRGEGARMGRPHRVPGVVENSQLRTNVQFIETERSLTTTVTTFSVKLLGSDGSVLGTRSFSLKSGQMTQANGIANTYPGVTPLDAGSLEIAVDSGNGTIAAVLRQVDTVTNEQPRVHASVPVEAAAQAKGLPEVDLAKQMYALLGVMHGRPADSPLAFRTLLGITAPRTDVRVTISLVSERALATPIVTTTIPATKTIEWTDALAQLFKLSPDDFARGSIIVEAAGDVVIYGTLTSPDKQTAAQVVGNLPSITFLSDAVIGSTPGLQRPVFFSGAEQYLDPSEGSRWKLELTELGGAFSSVMVLLYDASNRSKPIGRADVTLGARQHRVLDTIFSALGLDVPGLAADRRDVQIVVVPRSGTGRIAAVATRMSVDSGEQSKYILTPNGGIPADGRSLAAALFPPIEPVQLRLRPVRR